MHYTHKERLIEVLNIIKYSNNKDSFILEFEIMIQLEATVNVIDKLPSAVQEMLQKNDPSVIKQYVSAEIYRAEVLKVWEKKFTDLIAAASPVLNFTQKEKIKQLLVK